jgi:uncharacterized protein YqgC (DUF456 family)
MILPWLDTAFTIVILIGLIVAWLGTLIPIFPAPTVMWIFVLIYGVVTGFDVRSFIFFAVISFFTIAALLADNVLSIAGARKGGARWISVTVATTVGLVSSLFLTPIVGILLTLLALYLMEYAHRKDTQAAWDATKQMLLGWGCATVIRLIIGLIDLILWAIWAFA